VLADFLQILGQRTALSAQRNFGEFAQRLHSCFGGQPPAKARKSRGRNSARNDKKILLLSLRGTKLREPSHLWNVLQVAHENEKKDAEIYNIWTKSASDFGFFFEKPLLFGIAPPNSSGRIGISMRNSGHGCRFLHGSGVDFS
jgi:hypothetical protein